MLHTIVTIANIAVFLFYGIGLGTTVPWIPTGLHPCAFNEFATRDTQTCRSMRAGLAKDTTLMIDHVHAIWAFYCVAFALTFFLCGNQKLSLMVQTAALGATLATLWSANVMFSQTTFAAKYPPIMKGANDAMKMMTGLLGLTIVAAFTTATSYFPGCGGKADSTSCANGDKTGKK